MSPGDLRAPRSECIIIIIIIIIIMIIHMSDISIISMLVININNNNIIIIIIIIRSIIIIIIISIIIIIIIIISSSSSSSSSSSGSSSSSSSSSSNNDTNNNTSSSSSSSSSSRIITIIMIMIMIIIISSIIITIIVITMIIVVLGCPRQTCARLDRRGSPDKAAAGETRACLGEGRMNGVSTNGATVNFMFFDRGTFRVLPLTYFYLPKSARAYLFPQSVKIHDFCSGPISVDTIYPQPRKLDSVRNSENHIFGHVAFVWWWRPSVIIVQGYFS